MAKFSSNTNTWKIYKKVGALNEKLIQALLLVLRGTSILLKPSLLMYVSKLSFSALRRGSLTNSGTDSVWEEGALTRVFHALQCTQPRSGVHSQAPPMHSCARQWTSRGSWQFKSLSSWAKAKTFRGSHQCACDFTSFFSLLLQTAPGRTFCQKSVGKCEFVRFRFWQLVISLCFEEKRNIILDFISAQKRLPAVSLVGLFYP